MTLSTIDQTIKAGLDAKHQMMTHWGLAGKVVIIDEVHAYDAYMMTYLLSTLYWLGRYRTPVVLLSATLPPSLRRMLVEAYTQTEVDDSIVEATGYPLLTLATCDGEVTQQTCEPGESLTFEVVKLIDGETAKLIDHIKHVTDQGGNVVVIRNTVNRAINTHETLSEHFDCTLIHSRFTAHDRALREERLLDHFGSNATNRARGKVVVGTQVLEQSLDLDFDLVVTDLAPIDMVIQRAGRGWRTKRDRGDLTPRLVVLMPRSINGGTVLPYSEWVMAQSYDLLAAMDTFARPDDIPGMVRSAYEEDRNESLSDEYKNSILVAQRRAANRAMKTRDGSSMAGMFSKARDHEGVRDIDGDLCIVLTSDEYGVVRHLPHMGGEALPWDEKPTADELSLAMSATLNLSSRNIGKLRKADLVQKTIPDGWRNTPLADLVAIVLPADNITYDKEKGLIL